MSNPIPYPSSNFLKPYPNLNSKTRSKPSNEVASENYYWSKLVLTLHSHTSTVTHIRHCTLPHSLFSLSQQAMTWRPQAGVLCVQRIFVCVVGFKRPIWPLG